MINTQIKKLSFLLAIIVASSSFNAIAVETNFSDDTQKAIYLFRHESYDESLLIFTRLVEEDPTSSLAQYYLGLTYKRVEDYVNAKKYLEASVSLEPKIKGALIELIDVLYRLGDLDAAKRWITVAEKEGVRPAQAAFLKGLTLSSAKEHEEAITAFEDAKSLDSELTQACDYQIGIAYLMLNKHSKARDLFEDILSIDPHSDIAAYSQRYLEAIDKRARDYSPLHLRVSLGYEYDSNVLLKPNDTTLVTDIAQESDTRQVFNIGGDYTFDFNDSVSSMRLGYDLNISKQNDFGRYDAATNTLSAQPKFRFDRLLVSFPTSFSHTIIGNSQMAQLGLFYKYKDYQEPPFGDEDRTSDELLANAGYFWFFSKNKGFFGLKYGINKDWTRGNNWEYLGNKLGASLLIPFLDKFKFNVNGEIKKFDYENNHTIFNKKRDDLNYTASTMISYEFMEYMELQLKYIFVKNDSNLALYDYDREIVGSSIQYKF